MEKPKDGYNGLGAGWDDLVNQKVVESKIEGGAYLDKLEIGKKLKVSTENTIYTIEHREDGYYISGSQKYCPQPTKLKGIGSTWGGSMIKENYIGRGMRLEFQIPNHEGGPITTSLIKEVEEY